MWKSIKIWWIHIREKGFWKYLLANLPTLFLTIFSFLVVKTEIVDYINNNFLIFLLIFFVLFIFNLFSEISRIVEVEKTTSNLKKEVEELNKELSEKNDKILQHEDQQEQLIQTLKSLPTNLLHDFSEKLGLDNHDRITFYVYIDGKFVNIGRHSNNSNFVKTQYGNIFQENDNYISKSFHNESGDFYIRVSLPNPKKNFEKYCQDIQKDCPEFNQEKLTNVTMKSRCFFGKKIYSSDKKPIGVLMIESSKPNLTIRINGEVKKLMKKEDYATLSESIDHNFQYILQTLQKYIIYYY